jgi:hypothetical protein
MFALGDVPFPRPLTITKLRNPLKSWCGSAALLFALGSLPVFAENAAGVNSEIWAKAFGTGDAQPLLEFLGRAADAGDAGDFRDILGLTFETMRKIPAVASLRKMLVLVDLQPSMWTLQRGWLPIPADAAVRYVFVAVDPESCGSERAYCTSAELRLALVDGTNSSLGNCRAIFGWGTRNGHGTYSAYVVEAGACICLHTNDEPRAVSAEEFDRVRVCGFLLEREQQTSPADLVDFLPALRGHNVPFEAIRDLDID